MNRVINFLRDKAFVMILLACIVAATATSIWAIQTVRKNLEEGISPDEAENGNQMGDTFPQADLGGEDLWNQNADIVTDEMNGEIPLEEDGQAMPSAPPASSSSSSGVSSSSEPSATQDASNQEAVAAVQSFTRPVSGSVMEAFSGNELVFNETLGDWRTHNGTDYGAQIGESVFAPIDGEIVKVTTDGNWGGIVELKDSAGRVWRLCGVEKSKLSVGAKVALGEKLGEIAPISAEMAQTPHLHLEVVADGVYQDPETLFNA